MLDGGVNPESDMALKPSVLSLLVHHNPLSIMLFSRGSSNASNMGPKTQGHKESLHYSGPESIVGAVKDGDELSDIVRHCDLKTESYTASLASVKNNIVENWTGIVFP